MSRNVARIFVEYKLDICYNPLRDIMAKFKLQFRITILIASISLLLIFVFTTIQVRNHLDRLRSYNKYRARVGTIIVKTTLETMLKTVQSNEILTGIFRAAVTSFSKEGVVQKISMISMDGNAIATNDPLVKKYGETKKDIDIYLKLSKRAKKDAWFFSIINNKTKNIDIYVPVSAATGVTYIAKLSFSIGNVQQALVDILVPISMTAIAVIIGNIILGFVLARTIVHPIKILNTATKDIAAGNLDRSVKIETNDEIQELGETFNLMATALRKMRERAENANPLTHLPGNNMIREAIESRISKKLKFVAIHADLDHFKAFNDRYGIARGDDVIEFTSDVLRNAVKEHGNQRDFLGHEGGDDFYIITTPAKADAIAQQIIKDFDSKIKGFYSKEDQKIGHIISKDRKGCVEKFPLMSISLAGVSNQCVPILSYGELTNIAVGVKKKAKEAPKSNFLLDRRTV